MDYRINLGLPVLMKSLVLSHRWPLGGRWLFPPLLLGSRLPKEKGSLETLSYFVFLGVGYILIQVAFIQKFILFLGHPTYALTVIIFSMLVWSGVGSYFSGRIVASDDQRLIRVLAGIAVLIGVLAFSSAPMTAAAAGFPTLAKMAITALAILPAAFLMGMPFPSGLRRLEQISPRRRYAGRGL